MGSSSSTEAGGYRVARLGRPHGLDGFLGLYVDPEELVHFQVGGRVLVGGRELTVRAIRRADRGHQVAFEEVTDRALAEEIRGEYVRVPQRRPLGADEYWPEDLIGLEVRPVGGRVVAVEHGPTQSRLVVDLEGARFEVPFVTALVPVVDVASGFLVIEEVEGLIPPRG